MFSSFVFLDSFQAKLGVACSPCSQGQVFGFKLSSRFKLLPFSYDRVRSGWPAKAGALLQA